MIELEGWDRDAAIGAELRRRSYLVWSIFLQVGQRTLGKRVCFWRIYGLRRRLRDHGLFFYVRDLSKEKRTQYRTTLFLSVCFRSEERR